MALNRFQAISRLKTTVAGFARIQNSLNSCESSCESEFCVTTGRNVPTTQFNLAKKWLAKKWEPLLDWVPDIDLAEIRIERSYRFCGQRLLRRNP